MFYLFYVHAYVYYLKNIYLQNLTSFNKLPIDGQFLCQINNKFIYFFFLQNQYLFYLAKDKIIEKIYSKNIIRMLNYNEFLLKNFDKINY